MDEAQIRIGDRERDQAAGELGDHYAAGRLTMEEYSERLDQVHAARTRGDLEVTLRDLPSKQIPVVAQGRELRGYSGWLRRAPIMPVIGVVWVIAGMTGFWPVLFLVPVLWYLLSPRACQGRARNRSRWA